MNAMPGCPLCGAASQEAFIVGDRNRGLSKEQFRYLRCTACLTYFIAAVPTDLASFYPAAYYQLPTREDLELATPMESSKLELMWPFAASGPLVEIGSGPGHFAYAAAHVGFDVTSIEMDQRTCEHLRQVVGVEAIQSSEPEHVLPTLTPPRAVVLWHVLEHLPRPWEVLSGIAQLLEPGGVLALATPNPDALQFRLLGRRWAHVDAPRHLFLIPAAALRERAAELGLRMVLLTTSDPAGRYWNTFGWEYAVRLHPSARPSTRMTMALSRLIAAGLSPIERRGTHGAAYTAIFVKD
jgi:SAM-dependent methyltransferase